MKNKINIFSDNKIKFFLTDLFSDYELTFMNLNEIEMKINSTNANIIFINEEETSKLNLMLKVLKLVKVIQILLQQKTYYRMR